MENLKPDSATNPSEPKKPESRLRQVLDAMNLARRQRAQALMIQHPELRPEEVDQILDGERSV